MIQVQTCIKCGEIKPLSGFYKQWNRESYYSDCKACRNNYNRERDYPPTERPKACKLCGTIKDAIEFHNERRCLDGKRSICKACISARSKAYNAGNGAQRKARKLKVLYQLTQEQYDAMLESQRGICAICGETGSDGYGLVVDHDHACCPSQKSCGQCIRGLLCAHCNHLLGKAKDDVNTLESAIRYLKERSMTHG